MGDPRKQRPVAIALTCLIVLILSLFKHTGFEWYALVLGLMCASAFRFGCIHYMERNYEF